MNDTTFPVIPDERADDLHPTAPVDAAGLVLFMAGNQFMVMEDLLAAFRKQHPEAGPIYYQTLPPGLQLKQILAGGALFRGELLSVYPDIFSSVSEKSMHQLEREGHIEPGGFQLYLHNRLTLMVPAGNPARIRGVADLGRDEVRISQPDPGNEDIAYHILNMYREAGGSALVDRIMHNKLSNGTTLLTRVHHRETPERIAGGSADVGPVWATEVIHARQAGIACEEVAPGERFDQRQRINYYICALKQGSNPANAKKFLRFVLSPDAQALYQQFGFIPEGKS